MKADVVKHFTLCYDYVIKLYATVKLSVADIHVVYCCYGPLSNVVNCLNYVCVQYCEYKWIFCVHLKCGIDYSVAIINMYPQCRSTTISIFTTRQLAAVTLTTANTKWRPWSSWKLLSRMQKMTFST